MTFPRFNALCKYQKRNPPQHKLVAAYLGAGGGDDKSSGQDHRELAGMFGAG